MTRTKDGRNNRVQISFAVTIRAGRADFVLSLHVLAPANRTDGFIKRLNWCKNLQHFPVGEELLRWYRHK